VFIGSASAFASSIWIGFSLRRESWCNPLRVLRRSRTSRRPSSVRARGSAAKARARDLQKAWPALTPNQTRSGQSGANRRRSKGIRGRVWRIESPEAFSRPGSAIRGPARRRYPKRNGTASWLKAGCANKWPSGLDCPEPSLKLPLDSICPTTLTFQWLWLIANVMPKPIHS
jgi:hypothetical protein